ncbi:ElaA protein [Clostridium pascui]|uniref:GNAT family N-acetyltransferase n=1 Tax=Clostridium pascui TaxID=46609 RepID=UPI001956705F|nr:GNAT family N-acetyltransferase [Clostridium pascui]MBM7870420.1 ElaA protein [Clostridium pascui]
MNWIVKKFNELTPHDLYKILKERINVFVVEQNCPYEECDDKDLKSLHLYSEDKGRITAYCRLLYPGVSYNEAAIGRVLISEEYRRKGIAAKMLKKAIEIIKDEMGEKCIKLSAQVYAKRLYEQVGFKECSEIYNEDGIPHVEMIYKFN